MGRGLDGYFFLLRYPKWLTVQFSGGCPIGRSLAICGGDCERETPLPIPNRAVKPLSADGTWPARARESRTPPLSSQGRVGQAARPAFDAGGAREERHREGRQVECMT